MAQLAGRVIKIVFRANVPYYEVNSVCSLYGPVRQENQRENSFFLYLGDGIHIDRIDRIITKLRKNKKVRNVILM